MDAFARSLIIADDVLSNSRFTELKKTRYSSFDVGHGKQFEEGKLSLEDLRNIALI